MDLANAESGNIIGDSTMTHALERIFMPMIFKKKNARDVKENVRTKVV